MYKVGALCEAAKRRSKSVCGGSSGFKILENGGDVSFKTKRWPVEMESKKTACFVVSSDLYR